MQGSAIGLATTTVPALGNLSLVKSMLFDLAVCLCTILVIGGVLALSPPAATGGHAREWAVAVVTALTQLLGHIVKLRVESTRDEKESAALVSSLAAVLQSRHWNAVRDNCLGYLEGPPLVRAELSRAWQADRGVVAIRQQVAAQVRAVVQRAGGIRSPASQALVLGRLSAIAGVLDGNEFDSTSASQLLALELEVAGHPLASRPH